MSNLKSENDLSINCKDIESVSADLLYEKRRKTLLNGRAKWNYLKTFLKNLFDKNKNSNNYCCIAGDFNLNLLQHDKNKKVQNFLNLIYQNFMIPNINKPFRITKKIKQH